MRPEVDIFSGFKRTKKHKLTQMKDLLHKIIVQLRSKVWLVVNVGLVHIKINESIKPIQQKYCSIPLQYVDKFRTMLDE